MADQKISGLPPDSSLDGNHYFPLNDPAGPSTKRTLLSTLIAWLFTQENIPAGAGSPITRMDDMRDDWVLSGLGWTADSFGVTRNGSMASGIVYINGRKLSLNAVTARAFTASKDTYVDVIDNLNGTASLVYTEVANNATTGMTLAANSKRLCRVVTNGSAITMINQVGYDPLMNRYHNTVAMPPCAVGYTTIGTNWTWANGADQSGKVEFWKPRDIMMVGGKQVVRVQPYVRVSGGGQISQYRNSYIMRPGAAYVSVEASSGATAGQTANYQNNIYISEEAGTYYWMDYDMALYQADCVLRVDIHRDGAAVGDTAAGGGELEGIMMYYNRDYTKT